MLSIKFSYSHQLKDINYVFDSSINHIWTVSVCALVYNNLIKANNWDLLWF